MHRPIFGLQPPNCPKDPLSYNSIGQPYESTLGKAGTPEHHHRDVVDLGEGRSLPEWAGINWELPSHSDPDDVSESPNCLGPISNEQRATPQTQHQATDLGGSHEESGYRWARVTKRVFIVGCPRSGTTLLQAILGSHPSVYTLPETHYFRKLRGRLRRLGSLGLVSPRAAYRALKDLSEVTNQEPPIVVPGWPFVGAYGRALIAMLDAAASERGKPIWVEKSPLHLHYIREIFRFAPDAVFLHIVRDGRDVVASLYQLCQRDPKRWIPQLLPTVRPGDLKSLPDPEVLIEAAVDRWNRDVIESRRWRTDRRHLVVQYQELLDDPVTALDEACRVIGITFHSNMLRHWEVAAEVTGRRGELVHMEAVFSPIRSSSQTPFSLLSHETQRFITNRLLGGGEVMAALDG